MLPTISSIFRRHAHFGIWFSISKASVYFVPLLLAEVLPSNDYGKLEYALAGLGIIANTIINLGVPGAYPYFLLKTKKRQIIPSFRLHPLLLIAPFIINQILYFFLDLSLPFYLAFNISYILANQIFYSTQLKTHEKSIYAVILDSGIYMILLIYFILGKLNKVAFDLNIINQFILCYAFFYLLVAVFRFVKHKEETSWKNYCLILNFSIYLLVATFLIFLITSSGRILVEYIFSFKEVGVYAYYFRLAAIVVMIHQIINIAYFKKIYLLNPNVLDKYFFLFFIFVTVLSFLIYLISPFFLKEFSNFFSETIDNYKVIYFILSAQMAMWISTALNSNIVDREKLAPKNNTKFLFLVVLSVVFLFVVKDFISFEWLSFFIYSVVFLAALIQYHTLWLKGLFFKKSLISIIGIYILSSTYFFILIQ